MIHISYIKTYQLDDFNFTERIYKIRLCFCNFSIATKAIHYNINYKNFNIDDPHFQFNKISHKMLSFILEEEMNEKLKILSEQLDKT